MRGVIACIMALVFASAALAEEPRVTVSHGLTLADTLKYPAGFTHFDYVNPDAPKGGALRDYAGGGFDSLNPFILKGTPPKDVTLLYDSLMVTSEDEPMAAYGLIAETVEFPQDLSFIVFNLRPQARFHDGTPITADDVVFSLQILKDKGSPSLQFNFRNITKAEKLGPHRVRFDFSDAEPRTRELGHIAGHLPVLSKAYWEKREFGSDTLEKPLGNGPYRIAYFEPNRFIVYERVRDYWAKDLAVRRGQSNFDYIRYDYFRDDNVALEAFKTGLYDFRIETSAKTWESGYRFSSLESGAIVKEEVATKEPVGMQGFAFNLRRDKFKDIRVRKAITLAFDFEWANRNLFYGKYTRNDSFFANTDLAATGKPSADELALLAPWHGEIPNEVFGEAYQAPRFDGPGAARENLTEAAKLLREAGWIIEKGRLVDPKTRKPFTIEFMLTASEFERVVAPFIANLKRLGIAARIRTVDSPQYVNRVGSWDFDLVVATFPQSLSPGNDQRKFWSSAEADRPGSANIVGIKNKAVDALVEKIVAATSRKDAVIATRALDRVLSWSYYVVPQWYLDKYWLAYWNRFGIPQTRPEYGIGRSAWWYDPSKDVGMNRSQALR